MTRLLFISASPSDSGGGQAADDREFRSVREALARAGGGKPADLTHVPACTREDLLRELASKRPRILHFSGHGSELAIQLDNGRGGGHELSAFAMRSLVEACQEIRLVVLTACRSSTLAQMLLQVPHVQCVVAMDGAIERDSAIEFSGAFHHALAIESGSVAAAMRFGRAAIASAGRSGRELPQLWTGNRVAAEELRFPLEAEGSSDVGGSTVGVLTQTMSGSPHGRQVIIRGNVQGDVVGGDKYVGG